MKCGLELSQSFHAGVGARPFVHFEKRRGRLSLAARPFTALATTVVCTSTGTISSLNFPAAIAASAFLWLASENSSAFSRVMPYFLATFSAVSPMLR